MRIRPERPAVAPVVHDDAKLVRMSDVVHPCSSQNDAHLHSLHTETERQRDRETERQTKKERETEEAGDDSKEEVPETLQAYSTVLFFICHVGFHAGKQGSSPPKHAIGGGGAGGAVGWRMTVTVSLSPPVSALVAAAVASNRFTVGNISIGRAGGSTAAST